MQIWRGGQVYLGRFLPVIKKSWKFIKPRDPARCPVATGTGLYASQDTLHRQRDGMKLCGYAMGFDNNERNFDQQFANTSSKDRSDYNYGFKIGRRHREVWDKLDHSTRKGDKHD